MFLRQRTNVVIRAKADGQRVARQSGKEKRKQDLSILSTKGRMSLSGQMSKE